MNAITVFHPSRFQLGQIVATTGALDATSHDHRLRCLLRHAGGDWGNVCKDDAALNDEAIEYGSRILSAYPIDDSKPCKGHGSNTLWIITEADRSVTTLLLPEEYLRAWPAPPGRAIFACRGRGPDREAAASPAVKATPVGAALGPPPSSSAFRSVQTEPPARARP